MGTFRTIYATAAVLLILAWSAVAQQPEPEHRDDKYFADPHAFCRKGPDDPDDPSAHACSCSLICSEGTDSQPSRQMENTSCQLYCSKSRCACHPDNPCDTPPVL